MFDKKYKSPLEFDKALTKELGLTGELNSSLDAKLVYVKSQIEQFKQMIIRYEFDILLTNNLINHEVEAFQAKGRENQSSFISDAKQSTAALKTMIQLRDELEAEKEKVKKK
ncbi:hypothetical protein H0W80_00225 [Candidatus Saccharibacteria bacterium]|nr:hypothetical protein [Candidatus Saccharibacteria bacterium]